MYNVVLASGAEQSDSVTPIHVRSYVYGLPWCSDSKESACNAGDLGLIPGWGRSPGEVNILSHVLFHYGLLQDIEYISLCYCHRMLFIYLKFSSLHMKNVKVSVTQLCPTLCSPMDCSLPGSSVHGILQARILERVPIPFSSRSSWHRDQTRVSRITGRYLPSEPPRKSNLYLLLPNSKFIPSPPSSPFSSHKFVFYVCLFVFYK